MTFSLDPYTYLPWLGAFLLGLLFGWVIWGRVARHRSALLTSIAAQERARAETEVERDRLRQELAATREQLRPLADEVDRLKRDAARRPAVLETVAAAPVTAGAVTTASAGHGIRQLKGVGDKFAARLEALGLDSVDKLARLDDADVVRLDPQLSPFEGRLARDRVVEQAQLLSIGRIAEYEARFGRLAG